MIRVILALIDGFHAVSDLVAIKDLTMNNASIELAFPLFITINRGVSLSRYHPIPANAENKGTY
jgi:hypothetical protein